MPTEGKQEVRNSTGRSTAAQARKAQAQVLVESSRRLLHSCPLRLISAGQVRPAPKLAAGILDGPLCRGGLVKGTQPGMSKVAWFRRGGLLLPDYDRDSRRKDHRAVDISY